MGASQVTMQTRDPLGDRMKGYEREARLALPRRTLAAIRIDGRTFHSWTRGLRRPYDERLVEAMAATAKALCEEISGAVMGYVQSDEISILTQDFAAEGTQPWFGGQVQKISSVAASAATAYFNEAARGLGKRPAMFDARVFALPSRTEAANYLLWRQRDCRRNAISMLAEHHFSAKRLQGVSTEGRIELLREAGVDPAAVDEGFRFGYVSERVERFERMRYTDRRTGEERTTPEPVCRRAWERRIAPEFSARPGSWLWERIPDPKAAG